MIHTLLHLERPLIIPDVETTSLQSDARIIQLGFQMWTTNGLEKEWQSLINPGIPIPPESTEIHHITDEDMQRCQSCHQLHPTENCLQFKPVPRFNQLATNLAHGFTNVDFAGKNIRYDLRMISEEMTRCQVTWSYKNARIIDADRLEQLGEPRTLSHLYEKYTGKKAEDAHQALADVRMTTEIIEHQLQAYSVLPRDIKALHDLQWPGFIDVEGKFRFVNDIATCTFGKYRGVSVHKIPHDYWKWLIKSDFSNDIKEIANNALIGEFPHE